VFEKERQSILDPVAIVEDPDSEAGIICEGNHRAAAAVASGKKVRVAVLRTAEQLRRILREGNASRLARELSFKDFVLRAKAEAISKGFLKAGWQLYFDRMVGSSPVMKVTKRKGVEAQVPTEGVEDNTANIELAKRAAEDWNAVPKKDASLES